MKRLLLSGILAILTTGVNANMAYMGPDPGNVAGRNTLGKLRVRHEIITADLRSLPEGRIGVFADYRIQNSGTLATMVFLFVASGENPVNPEIILDGKVVAPARATYRYKFDNRGYYLQFPGDSLSEIIGFELEGDSFFQQKTENELWAFTLNLSSGLHHLKVGYEVTATAFEIGDLRYWTFPYYLGNKFTRPLYDTIILKALLPDEFGFRSNLQLKKNSHGVESNNIAGFRGSHIYVAVFKDIQGELNRGRALFLVANLFLWIVLALGGIFAVKWWIRNRKKLRYFMFLSIPVAIVVSWCYYYGMEYYYHYFDVKYDLFLRKNWGKGYWALQVVPVTFVLAFVLWSCIVLLYSLVTRKKKQAF